MKIFIASDLHGSAKFTQKLFEAFDNSGADLIVLLGDLYYHGVRNPLPEGHDPMKVVEVLNAHSDKLIVVRGNCDSEVDLSVSKFPIVKNARIFADGKHLYFCHGDNENFENLPALPKGSIFCQGHTHVATLSEFDGITLLNPGSVSLPKGGTERGYALFENGNVKLVQL